MSQVENREFFDRLRDLFLADMGLASEPAPDGSFTLGRYLLHEELGRGAQARVYRGLHRDLMKPVAVKVFDGPLSDARRERLHREAMTGARLEHDNIVAIHDVGYDRDRHFIAMDLVEGITLREWMAQDGHDLDERLCVLEKIARAVHYAHGRGVLHRDLKPDNVLVTAAGEPVVVDFGLAWAAGDPRLTCDGTPVGTPAYMAPEQVRGALTQIDERTDVYALGVMLFEAGTGVLPFDSRNPAELYETILIREPVAPSRLVPSLPRDFDAVCATCLEKDRALRYDSAEALAEELRRCRQGEPVMAAHPSRWGRWQRRLLRRKARAAVTVVAVVMLAGGAWLAIDAMRARDRLSRRQERMEAAHALQTAKLELEPRVLPLLDEAVRERYRAPRDGEAVARLVAQVDSAVADAGDESGVGAAYRAWVRFLVGTPGGAGLVADVRARHADNPFVVLMSARCFLLRYAETTVLPSSWVPLHRSDDPINFVLPEDSAERRALLRRAREELALARRSEVWPLLGDLEWMGDLCDGYLAYAEGDLERAIARLEPLAQRADVPIEAHLICSHAFSRLGDVDRGLATARALAARHPGMRLARQHVANALCLRGMVRLAQGHDGMPDFEEARRLQLDLAGGDAETVSVVDLDHKMVEQRRLKGEDVGAAFDALEDVYTRILARHPRSADALAGRALCRCRLGEADPRGGKPATPDREDVEEAVDVLEEALEDLERLAAVEGPTFRALVLRVDVGLKLFRRKMKLGEIAEEEWRQIGASVDRLEGEADEGYVAYYRAFISFMRADESQRLGEIERIAHLHRAIEEAGLALKALPQLDEARQIDLTARLLLAHVDPASAPDAFLAVVEETRRAAERSPAFAHFPAYVAAWVEQLLREPRTRLDAGELAETERVRALGMSRALIEAYEWMLEDGGDDHEPHLRLAGAYHDAARFDPGHAAEWTRSSLDVLDELTASRPALAAPYINRAALYLALAAAGGDASDDVAACVRLAVLNAERACRRAPESPRALTVRGRARAAAGRLAEARADLEAARARTTDDALRRMIDEALRRM